MKLCLNKQVVPLEKQTLDITDPCGLFHADVDLEEQETSLVSFKATSDMEWLCKTFELSSRWWVNNCSKIPLLNEIREAIKESRP